MKICSSFRYLNKNNLVRTNNIEQYLISRDIDSFDNNFCFTDNDKLCQFPHNYNSLLHE